jgi:Tol biopolymer transport system component
MQPDGSDVQRYTRTFADEGHPAWSPDGAHLLFHARVLGAGRSPALDIYRHPASSPIGRETTPRLLTEHPANDIQATWTPVQH